MLDLNQLSSGGIGSGAATMPRAVFPSANKGAGALPYRNSSASGKSVNRDGKAVSRRKLRRRGSEDQQQGGDRASPSDRRRSQVQFDANGNVVSSLPQSLFDKGPDGEGEVPPLTAEVLSRCPTPPPDLCPPNPSRLMTHRSPTAGRLR